MSDTNTDNNVLNLSEAYDGFIDPYKSMKAFETCKLFSNGETFNQLYKGFKFYKFIDDNFTYKVGLNCENTDSDNYFFEEANCHLFWADYSYEGKLAYVQIPNDAKIYIDDNIFKTDKLIITKIDDFSCVADYFWINIIKKTSLVLEHTKNLNERECVLTDLQIQQNSSALRFVKEQTEYICKLAIQQHADSLRFVKNQTYNLCKLAVNNDKYAIANVKEQFKTNELCKLAVLQYGYMLRYVKEQTEEICRIAVQQDGRALEFVKDEFISDEICRLAVQQNGEALEFVKNQNEIICKIAVQQNGLALKYVKEQNERICEIAVQQNGLALKYVRKQTERICEIAVLRDYAAINFVKKEFKTKELLNIVTQNKTKHLKVE